MRDFYACALNQSTSRTSGQSLKGKFNIAYARDEELQLFYRRAAIYYSTQPWQEFRNCLPVHATIADAQALFPERLLYKIHPSIAIAFGKDDTCPLSTC